MKGSEKKHRTFHSLEGALRISAALIVNMSLTANDAGRLEEVSATT